MAKKKKIEIVALKCSVCDRRNYTVYKNRDNKEKLELRKYCKHCRKHTMHKETKAK